MKTSKEKPLARKKQSMPHPVDTHVSRRIRRFRRPRGMSQADLSGQIEVKFQLLHRYERVDNRTPSSRLKMAAEALDVVHQGLVWARLAMCRHGQSMGGVPTARTRG